MRAIRTMLTIGLFALLGFGFLYSAPSSSAHLRNSNCDANPQQCATFTGKVAEEAALCLAVFDPISCAQVWDAREWALERTDTMMGDVNNIDGDMGNAFQHCVWMGAVATRIGYDNALIIGANHEYVFQNTFPLASMDFMNNTVGAQIGVDAVNSGTDDTWGYVMNECESLARSNQLYGPCGIQGSYGIPWAPYDKDDPAASGCGV